MPVHENLIVNFTSAKEEGRYFTGTEVEFSCQNSYRVNDSALITNKCLFNGSWELPFFPSCVAGFILSKIAF